MPIVNEVTQKKIRRFAMDALLAYNMQTGQPMGQILDLSATGMKLMSEEPVNVSQIYYCRIPLDKKVNGRREIFIDAECRWCKLNEETSWYNSGYLLRYPTPADAQMVKTLMHGWMKAQSNKLNARLIGEQRKKPGFWARVFGAKK